MLHLNFLIKNRLNSSIKSLKPLFVLKVNDLNQILLKLKIKKKISYSLINKNFAKLLENIVCNKKIKYFSYNICLT